MPKISGHTQLLGVIGDPIAHTLSPAMHNAALEHLGLDYVYVPFWVKPQQLGVAIAGLDALNVVGFNVTLPHKETILPYLADVSDLAQQVGAVNTVYRSEKGWVGTNTDVHGFLAPLRQQSYPWSEIAVLVLGYGGAARAVVTACYDLGCRQDLYQWSPRGTARGLCCQLATDHAPSPFMVRAGQLFGESQPCGQYHPHWHESPYWHHPPHSRGLGTIAHHRHCL